MFPENLVQACFQQMQTDYVTKNVITSNGTVETLARDVKYTDGINVLGKSHDNKDINLINN